MDWTLFTPELVLLVAAALFLTATCLKTDARRQYHFALALAALSVAASLA
ncbi:MAG: hypothetical protein WBY88_01685 [Desulfosarcina sp.]